MGQGFLSVTVSQSAIRESLIAQGAPGSLASRLALGAQAHEPAANTITIAMKAMWPRANSTAAFATGFMVHPTRWLCKQPRSDEA